MNSKHPIRAALDLARSWGSASPSTRPFHPSELPSRAFRSMGTLARLTLGPEYADRLESATEQVRAIFDRLESEMSAYRPASAVNELARNAGAAPVAVSEDTYRVLSLGKDFGGLSSGTFDITAAPLVRLWGFSGAPAPMAAPADESIREVLKLVDYRRLELREGTAFLPAEGMALDVGGIAKGYAVDRAYDYCLSAGIRDFLIDFSGNVRAAGSPSRREGWQIGVRDPFDASRMIGAIALPAGLAVATSGSYERFVDIAGKRFSHIINPRTGYPATDTASVTVLSSDAATADALSTAFFIAGPEQAPELLKQAASVELLLVPDRYPAHLWLTSGLDEAFTTGSRARRSLLR